MNPTTTEVQDQDKWRARINRALSELTQHSDHIEASCMTDDSEAESQSAVEV